MDTEPFTTPEELRAALSADGQLFLKKFMDDTEPRLPLHLAVVLGENQSETRRILQGYREAKDWGLVKTDKRHCVVFTELGEEVAILLSSGEK